MKKIHVATSPLTGTIFAGTLMSDNKTWSADKQDVTVESLVAVAEHTIKFGEPVVISDENGTPIYKINVEKC